MFLGKKSMNVLRAHSKEPNHVTKNINQASHSSLSSPPLSSGLKIQKHRIPSDLGGSLGIDLSQLNIWSLDRALSPLAMRFASALFSWQIHSKLCMLKNAGWGTCQNYGGGMSLWIAVQIGHEVSDKPAPNWNIDTNMVAPSNSKETVKMSLEHLDYLQAFVLDGWGRTG